MRILYVSCHPHLRTDSNAGYATHIRETVAALQRRGHAVETWIAGDADRASAGAASTGPALAGSAVTTRGRAPAVSLLRRVVPRFAWRGLRDLALVRHARAIEPWLRAEVKRVRPDVIYERAAYLSSAGTRVAVATKTPLILEVNAPYVEERRNLNGLGPMDGVGQRWETDVVNAAALVVTVSSVLRDRLVETAGVPGARVRVQPNGVDMGRFHAGVPSARVALGLPADAFVVCFVGSFIRWHRLEVLIDAVAALADSGAPAYALLVGDGDVRGELEARARERGVSDRIRFTGTVPFEAVPAHIQAADVCVIPGHAWYCSPIKLFEYGGVGKAVISLDSAPVREVAQVGRDCRTFDGSAGDLESELRRLMLQPDVRADLAANLHRAVAQRFTWDAAAIRIERWMAEVTDAPEAATG